jgi:iron(III) transport system permease protein
MIKTKTSRSGFDTNAFVIFLVLIGFFAIFLFYPIAYMFGASFIIHGQPSLVFFQIMFTDRFLTEALLNSILIGVLSTIFTALLSLPLAFLLVRYNFSGKNLLQGLLLVPLVMPPFVGAIGMKQIFSRYGSLNLLLIDLGLMNPSNPYDWFGGGFWGIILMEVLHLYPIMYLSVAAALANVDPSLEEAAESLGVKGFTLFRKITFPLTFPGFFAGAIIVFIWAFTDLGTPLIFDFNKAVPSLIFRMTQDIQTNPMGYALAIVTLGVSVVALLSVRRYVGLRSYEMLGRGHVTPRSTTLTGWKAISALIALVAIILVALIPHASVILTSVAGRWFQTVLPSEYTLAYYSTIITHPVAGRSISNSLFYSILSTAIDITLGFLIAYMLARRKFPGRDILDSVAMMPLAIPGVVIAFGYLAAFSKTPLDAMINPVPLLIISYSVRRLPYTVRAAYAGFQQTSVYLEEAAMNLGASPLRTLRAITLPLILANVVAGGILSFSAAMMEVSDSLILAPFEEFYPMTKAMYSLNLRLSDGAYVASALGVIGIIVVAICFLVANKLLGKSMGELFRAA